MEIYPLSEGSFTIDQSKLFVPFNSSTDDLQDRTRGSLLVEVQPFAVVMPGDVLLLDTGLGFGEEGGQTQLYENLVSAGIQPAQVTKILLSHLHKDHAGGVSRKDEYGKYHLSFPNATFYVQKGELAFAFEKGFPSYLTEELECLRDSPQVHLVEGDGTIGEFIRYQVTGAHSPYHQVFWIKVEDETLFFGGDDAPQLQQMKNRFIAKYDYDGKKAMQLRSEWWKRGEEQRWTFLFYHDIKTPIYQG